MEWQPPRVSKWPVWLLIWSHACTAHLTCCLQPQRLSSFLCSPGAGIAARVPYTHCLAIGCQEQVSQQHELIAAVTRIRAELSGEDFREFMRKGATQRSTVHAYLDLFCYQQPAYRCAPPLLSPCMAPLPCPLYKRSVLSCGETLRSPSLAEASNSRDSAYINEACVVPLVAAGLPHPLCVQGCEGVLAPTALILSASALVSFGRIHCPPAPGVAGGGAGTSWAA